MRRAILLAVLILVVVSGAVAAAHELWVTSSAWRTQPAATVTVLTHVGDRFPNANSFTTPDRIDSVRLVGPGIDAIQTPALRRENDSLAADVTLPSSPGTYMAIVTVKPRTIEKSAGIFAAHLQHQGLDHVRDDRARQAETSKAVRERYSRYGKTLIRAGDGSSAGVTRPAGVTIELVPLTDPTTLRRGDRLRLQLLFEGKPASGVLVGAIYATAKSKADEWPLTARTDARGEVAFTLQAGGPWLIRAVQMVRRTGETGEHAADWETYWASLTFALAEGSRRQPKSLPLTPTRGPHVLLDDGPLGVTFNGTPAASPGKPTCHPAPTWNRRPSALRGRSAR